MATEPKTPATDTTPAAPSSTDDWKAAAQKAADDAAAKGYVGAVPDETPNEDYTVQGVTKKGTK